MPQDIFYQGNLYYKNVMYDIPEDFATKVQEFRERELKELTIKSQLDQAEKETQKLTPQQSAELEEWAKTIAEKPEAETKPVIKTTRRKPLEDKEES